MALTLDGTASSTSSSITLSTSNANDLILVAIQATGSGSVTGVSGAGLSWGLRYSGSVTPDSGGSKIALYLYYALAASPLSSATISIATSGTVSLKNDAWGVSGAAQFDTNASLPAVASYNAKTKSSTPSVSGVSTTSANSFLFSVVIGTTGNYPGSGFATIVSASPDNQYDIVSSTQSSITTSFGSSAASNAWLMLTDAAVAAQPGTGTAAGVATATATGRTSRRAAGTATGAATASGVGRGVRFGAGTAAGSSTASGVGIPTGHATGTAAGSSTATGVGHSLAKAAGTAAGSSVARGVPKATGTGTAAGSSTASGVGVRAVRGVGTAAGAATASGTTTAIKKAHGTAAGAASATGVGVKARAAAGAAAGSSTASGAGAYFTAPILNWFDTVISQYANSPILLGILSSFDAAEDPSGLFDAFYNNIWNIDTAQGIGLDIWGRIVGVPRTLQIESGKFFGFDEATTASADPFNQSPFYGGGSTTSNYVLSDDAYRQLILAKAAANIWDGSIPAINQILMTLFGASGNCYVRDNGNMTMDYVFSFDLSPVQSAIVGSGILPKPAGVSVSIVQP